VHIGGVCWSGKETEDAGGVRRELWRLFEESLKESYYFEGADQCQLIPRYDTIALQVKCLY